MRDSEKHYDPEQYAMPKGLFEPFSAVKLAAALKESGWELSPERLSELATSGYLPHCEFGGAIIFHKPVATRWLMNNLVKRSHGAPFPTALPVFVDYDKAKAKASDLPTTLWDLSPMLRKVPWADYVGVYFLIRGRHVVYVGQSTNILSRVATHRREKDFDAAYFLRVPASDLDRVEASFITVLEPEYNGGKPCKITLEEAEEVVDQIAQVLGLPNFSSETDVA